MNEQERIEQVLKQIHLLMANAMEVPDHQNLVILDKREVFELLEEINRSMLLMMDSYEITVTSRESAERQTQKKAETLINNSQKTADDIYAASILYMEDALRQLHKRMEQLQREMDRVTNRFRDDITQRIAQVDVNQQDLRAQLTDLMADETYLNLVKDMRRKEEAKEREAEAYRMRTPVKVLASSPEVYVNPDYVEDQDLIYGDTERVYEKAKVTVNENAEYFKWKAAHDQQADIEEAKRLEEQEAASGQSEETE